MIDDILGELLGEAAFGKLSKSRRAQLLFSLFFGLLGTVLGILGAVHFLRQPDLTQNGPLRVCMGGLFIFLACFSLFNVGLRRKWRWPGILFVVSLVGLFVARILFGP